MLGMNIGTCFLYSTYSGYLPEVISSVSQVDPWNSRIRKAEPANVQLYSVLVEKQAHW